MPLETFFAIITAVSREGFAEKAPCGKDVWEVREKVPCEDWRRDFQAAGTARAKAPSGGRLAVSTSEGLGLGCRRGSLRGKVGGGGAL